MSRFISMIYDQLMAGTEEACLIKWRQELLRQVSGYVLEIGAGTGANLNYYPPDVKSLLLSEPEPNMRARLKQKAEKSSFTNLNVVGFSAESLEIGDNSQDFVISTLVCCSVAKMDSSLLEIKRVLKNGGSFIFLEHVGAALGSKRRTWQNRLTPLWKRIAGNCHLNRDTEFAIKNAGFVIQEIQRESMRKAIPLVRPTIRGIAIKSGDEFAK